MKPVRCSWVDMLEIHRALSAGPESAAALVKGRCADESTVRTWKAASDILSSLDGRVEISTLSNFQPSHAVVIARHLRREKGNDPTKWDADEVADLIDRCEAGEWTVQEFRRELVAVRTAPESAECCTAGDLAKLAATGARFGTVYADPPWSYGNQATRAATGGHYDTMTVAEIAALPVRDLAAPRSHLWLWTTNAFLFECPRLFEAWGFEFKSSFVWVKPQMGIGNYLRNSHELLLLAVRGGLTGAATDVRSWGEFDRTAHSAKPEKVRSRVVERVSPGPRLELFGRRAAPGWVVWGNQITATMFDGDVRDVCD